MYHSTFLFAFAYIMRKKIKTYNSSVEAGFHLCHMLIILLILRDLNHSIFLFNNVTRKHLKMVIANFSASPFLGILWLQNQPLYTGTPQRNNSSKSMLHQIT